MKDKSGAFSVGDRVKYIRKKDPTEMELPFAFGVEGKLVEGSVNGDTFDFVPDNALLHRGIVYLKEIEKI